MAASRKRGAPAATAPGRRRSGRTSAAATKSKYFEGSDDDSDGATSPPPSKKRRASSKKSTAKDEDDGDEYRDEPEVEAQDEDGDEDEAVDEDAPMKTTVVPLVQMRGEGGVEYEDHRVHRNTLLFLRDLKANNQRSWLKANDGEYRRALKDWESFVEATTQTVVEVDETVPELPVKDVAFRIHRDIRFSKDPTPYKPHFSAAWSRTGRKGPYAVYYIHCETGRMLVGGGLWFPERDKLARVREHIDQHPRRWRRALSHPDFQRVFFPELEGAKEGSADADALVEAFAERNAESALKKRPQGYDEDHRDIRLLRLKCFTVVKTVDDDALTGDDAQEQLRDVIRGLHPLVTFLNSVAMPDPGMEDSESEEDDEE